VASCSPEKLGAAKGGANVTSVQWKGILVRRLISGVYRLPLEDKIAGRTGKKRSIHGKKGW